MFDVEDLLVFGAGVGVLTDPVVICNFLLKDQAQRLRTELLKFIKI